MKLALITTANIKDSPVKLFLRNISRLGPNPEGIQCK